MPRQTVAASYAITVGTADQLILPPNPRRVALIIGGLPGTSTTGVWLTLGGVAAAAGQGFSARFNTTSFVLSDDDLGTALQTEVRGIASAAGTILPITEILSA